MKYLRACFHSRCRSLNRPSVNMAEDSISFQLLSIASRSEGLSCNLCFLTNSTPCSRAPLRILSILLRVTDAACLLRKPITWSCQWKVPSRLRRKKVGKSVTHRPGTYWKPPIFSRVARRMMAVEGGTRSFPVSIYTVADPTGEFDSSDLGSLRRRRTDRVR